jgi:hypothetical protein
MSIQILGNKIYPAWRHNREGDSKIVNSKAEDKKLGDDWADSPAAFEMSEVPAQEAEPESDV